MASIELLRAVYQWLPVLFALDLLLFHLVADHPLAARWWWKRPGRRSSRSFGLRPCRSAFTRGEIDTLLWATFLALAGLQNRLSKRKWDDMG